ncbi:MAG: tetratricopeptide repeat protein [Desulfobacterales bacterium]|nr:tetratricopeptide repeat protein [Desulfobacterales bacterium]
MKGRLDEAVKAYREVPGDQSPVHRGPQQPGDRLPGDEPARQGREGVQDGPATIWPTRTASCPISTWPGSTSSRNRLDEAFGERPEVHPDQAPPGHGPQPPGPHLREDGTVLGEAVASYEAAVKIVPDDVSFNYNLAVAYFKNDGLRPGPRRSSSRSRQGHGRRRRRDTISPLPEARSASADAAGPPGFRLRSLRASRPGISSGPASACRSAAPIEASFKAAISSSISGGTGKTFLSQALGLGRAASARSGPGWRSSCP